MYNVKKIGYIVVSEREVHMTTICRFMRLDWSTENEAYCFRFFGSEIMVGVT